MSLTKQVLTLSRTRAELATLAGTYEIQPTEKQFCSSTKRYMYRDLDNAFHDILDLDPTLTTTAGDVLYVGADTYRMARSDGIQYTDANQSLALTGDYGYIISYGQYCETDRVLNLDVANSLTLWASQDWAAGDSLGSDMHRRRRKYTLGTTTVPVAFANTDVGVILYNNDDWVTGPAGNVQTNKVELITEANGVQLDCFWKWSAQTTAGTGIADLAELGLQNGWITTDINHYNRRTDSAASWSYWQNITTGDASGLLVGINANEDGRIENLEAGKDIDIVTSGGTVQSDSAIALVDDVDAPVDYVKFTRTADGGLTITTLDAAGADADITLSPDGNTLISSGYLGLGTPDPDYQLHATAPSYFASTVGIGITPVASGTQLYVGDNSLETDSSYQAIHGTVVKTGGVSDASDDYYAGRFQFQLDQAAGVIGEAFGLYGKSYITDGTADNTYGVYGDAEIAGGSAESGDLYGGFFSAVLAGGTVSGDIVGIYGYVDDAVGAGGDVCQLKLEEAGGTADYGIHQSMTGAGPNLVLAYGAANHADFYTDASGNLKIDMVGTGADVGTALTILSNYSDDSPGSATAVAYDALIINGVSDADVTNGFGVNLVFQLENTSAGHGDSDAAQITALWHDESYALSTMLFATHNSGFNTVLALGYDLNSTFAGDIVLADDVITPVDYTTLERTADGGLTITTVDADGADADILLQPDGYVGINDASPSTQLTVTETAADALVANLKYSAT